MIRATRHFGARWAAALAIVGTCSSAASAFSYFQVSGQTVVWSGNQSERFLSPSTFPEGSVTLDLILEAMGLWTIIPATNFTYSATLLDQDYPIDNFDGFSDTAAVPAAQLDPGTLGVTYLVNQGAFWYDMDVLFSDLPDGVGYSFDTNPDCQVIENPVPTNGYSFLLVATHEMGHAIGLGHDPIGNEPPGAAWFVAMMNPRYPSGGTIGDLNIVELHTDDRNGVRFLYPHSGPSQPPFRDLATSGYVPGPELGKAVPVYFTPASVAPEEVLTVRSVIENFGSTNQFFVDQGFFLSENELVSTGDLLIGEAQWDIAFEDAFDFEAEIDMPADIAAGTYYLGTILDYTNLVTEVYEDNNAMVYCEPLVIEQLPPIINTMGQDVTIEGLPYTGPMPTVTRPLNAAPLTWSIDNPPPGMTINPATGVISWPDPVAQQFQYTLFVRATNSAGSSTTIFFLGVVACNGDADHDQDVDIADLNTVLGNFGSSGPAGDLNNDQSVNTLDLNLVIGNFGETCTTP